MFSKGVCYEMNKRKEKQEDGGRGNASAPHYFPFGLAPKKYERRAFWMHVKRRQCVLDGERDQAT